MESVFTLLEKGTKICRTKRELATRMECSEQTVQALLRKRRHLTTRQCVTLAALLGLDAKDVAAQDLLERERDPIHRKLIGEGFFGTKAKDTDKGKATDERRNPDASDRRQSPVALANGPRRLAR